MTKHLNTNILTLLAGTTIFFIVLFTVISQAKWNDPNGVITGDVRGYYAYLPALFIHNDIQFKNPNVYNQSESDQIWTSETEDGKLFIKYTCGMAILYSPFFAAGNLYAKNSHYKANGYSAPYKVALVFGSLLYLIISLVFVSKVIRLYFSDIVCSVTIIVMFLGSNLFHYLTGSMTYSHGFSFALISVFMYSSIMWLNKPRAGWSILVGSSIGLIALIRPIDIAFLLFLPLINVNSIERLRQRFILFWGSRWLILLMVCFAFLMILPQLIYFKLISGNFFFYSYDKESFFFLNPRFIDSFFSYRNGWLVYSPLMIFSILGLFINKNLLHLKLYTRFVFVLYSFVIVSWWCWWYVGFGNRAFINLYPLLTLSLGGFISWVVSQKKTISVFFNIFVLLGLSLNIKQNSQFNTGAIHWDSMTKKAYWDSFGRDKPSQLFNTLLEKPITSSALKGENVVESIEIDVLKKEFFSYNSLVDCDSTSKIFFNLDKGINRTGGLSFHKENEYLLQKLIVPEKKATHIYLSAWVSDPKEIHLVIDGNDLFSFYSATSEVSEKKNGWYKLHLNVLLPKEKENLRFYLWNKNKNNFNLDNLTIEHTKHNIKTSHSD